MKHIEGDFQGVRDMNIYYQGWLPEVDVKAVLPGFIDTTIAAI